MRFKLSTGYGCLLKRSPSKKVMKLRSGQPGTKAMASRRCGSLISKARM